MSEANIDIQLLDDVMNKTVVSVEESKEKIFEIAENAHKENNFITLELETLRNEIDLVITQTDELEWKAKQARQRLANISRGFKRYSELEIREAYEMASQMQIQLSLSRDKEKHLRERRDELERRHRNILNTIEKSENLISQMGIVLNYLQGDLRKVGIALESAHHHQLLGIQIIQAQEEERKRVARDIHDGPAQSMANVALRSEIVEKMLNQNRIDEAKVELRLLKELTRASLVDVRKIIFDLRPMALDDLGLTPTLRKYLEEYEKRHHIETKLTLLSPERRLQSSIEVAVFRLIQESLNNTAKHANAKQVEVKLEFKPNKVLFMVADNGIGFEKQAKGERPQFGIMGMQERVKLLQGTMKIESKPGKGTILFFGIPLRIEENTKAGGSEK
ncbi:two-component system sensor histidine kinase DegS [Aneurinibacillus soli]|uniref:Signal transduction histidine-protein kinase/phosphatase DegS n=1 Tax=Aneurinibacillus soli TaxID=1500254 RepID=A0A0U5ARW0_9BACL|nr:sensor histidine kinase [Aneurinibacillus soli]PYE61500.1 two-component system sensor histidine kinase DegS [Aneurinibacillus soli]BAU26545.1 Signal transduction histidine-protein kinase/phosphatase DegS [Aneurinibacillus soli]